MRLKYFLTVATLVIGISTISAQQLIWKDVINAGVNDLELGPSERLYCAGSTTGGDVGTNGITYRVKGFGSPDMFIGSYSPDSCGFEWAHSMGSYEYQHGVAVETDKSGNVYFGGVYFEKIDIDPGPDSTFFEPFLGYHDQDAAIAKFDSSGKLIKAIHVGDSLGYGLISKIVNYKDKIYVIGRGSHRTRFGPVRSGYTLTGESGYGAYITVLDTGLNVIHVHVLKGVGIHVSDLVVNSNGDCFIVGAFQNSVDFNPDGAPEIRHSQGRNDAFVLALDAKLKFNWVYTAGGPWYNLFKTIGIDSNEDLVVTGTYSDTLNLSVNGQSRTIVSSDLFEDAIILKLNDRGVCQWMVNFGSEGIDLADGVDFDRADNIYVIGNFTNTIDFDPSINQHLANVSNANRGYLLNLSPNGNFKRVIVNDFTKSSEYPNRFDVEYENGSLYAAATNNSYCHLYKFRACSHTQDSIVVNSCKRVLSPSGNKLWSASGQYTDIIANASGCDSMIYADVTINLIDGDSLIESTCNAYTSPSGNYQWTQSGQYKDYLTSSNGCDSVVHVDLTINTLDTGITWVNTDLVANEIGATYQWIDCLSSQAIPGETNRLFTPLVSGMYAVMVQNQHCADTTSCTRFDMVSVPRVHANKDINIYPNPTEGGIYLESTKGEEIEDIKVLNLSGQHLDVETVKHADSRFYLPLAIESGVYLIQVITHKGSTSTHRVVKH